MFEVYLKEPDEYIQKNLIGCICLVLLDIQSSKIEVGSFRYTTWFFWIKIYTKVYMISYISYKISC